MQSNPELIQRHTSLSAHIVAFCRFLRTEGFPLGPAEQALALDAVEHLGFSFDQEAFRLCLKAVLARSKSQQERFDILFPKYFKELEQAVDAGIKNDKRQKKRPEKSNRPPSLEALKHWLYGKPTEETVEMAVYSGAEALSEKDFSRFNDNELAEIRQLIRQLARTLAFRFSRRRVRAKRKNNLDLRQTLRHNLRQGGELLELRFVKPKRQRRQLLLVCDVSKSMELYSHFLIQFSYAFQQAFRQIETFVFGTELQRITPLLRGAEYSDALLKLQEQAGSWSGGTRIGSSLATLNRSYRYLLKSQTVLIILSDGMDTGAPELLAQQMQLLHRRCARLIWLNPLAGRPGYSPKTRGMEAAIPFVDVFAPAHNIESLRNLAKYIGRRQ
jgi:hypothetical protein